MKRLAILGSIMAAGLAAAGLHAQGLPGIGATEQVSEHVYKIFGAGGNTTFFIRSDGVVLVDTKLANNGAAILAKVREVTDKPVTMIINTHSHPDHMGSNTEINTARGSVQIVAHQNSANRINAMPNQAQVATTFTDRLTLGSGADQIDLYYFGPAHTDGDAWVVYPAERVMNIGDVMAWDMGLLVDPMSGGSMVGTADTVAKAAAALTGVDRVIEGHGDANTWAGFLRYVAYCRKVIEVAQRGNDEGLNYVEAYDKYFAADPAMAPYIGEALKPGLEYGGTPKSRSLNNIFIAMMELKGEKPPLIMGAPPPPGQPLPTGPGGGSGGRVPRNAPAGDEHVL